MADLIPRRAWLGAALGATGFAVAMQSPAPSTQPPAMPGPRDAETYAWRRVAIGGGGFITGLAMDPTGATRVARADVYGAYIWRTDLDRWVQLVTSATMPEEDRVQDGMNEGVFEVAVAPSDPDRIYLAAKGRIYRSDDRGARFATLQRGEPFPLAFDANSEHRLSGPFLAVNPRDPSLLLFGTPADGLWRSADGGARWSQIASVPLSGVRDAGICVWFSPQAAGGHVWAMSPGYGVHVSDDAGETFRPLVPPQAIQPATLVRGDFAPDGTFFAVDAESRSAWRWREGTWSRLTGLPERRFVAVAVHPRGGQILVFDEGGRTYRSTDGGAAWVRLQHRSRVGPGDPPWLHVSNQSYFAMGMVLFDPVAADRLWVGAGTGVYAADLPPRGPLALTPPVLEWVSQTRGIEELVANDVVHPPGGAPLFAAWDFGIHRKESLDEFSRGFGPRERVLIAAQQLAWSPADPRVIVTNASDTRTDCCAEDGDAVMAGYSLDGGRRWTKFATLPQPPGTDASDPWRMSFGTISLASDDTRNIVWAPSHHRSPFYTRDRGASWHRVVLSGEVLPFTGSHSAHHFHRKTLAADPVLSGTFYLVHSGDGANPGLAGLWVTRDGGAEWERVFAGEIAPESQYSAKLRPVPGRSADLFFTSGVAGTGDTRLRRSTDGGKTWIALDGIRRVDDVGFGRPGPGSDEPTCFISGQVEGRYGIWRSTDGGAGWTMIGRFPVGTLDQVVVVAGDPDRFGRVYLGYKGSGWIHGAPAPCSAAPYAFPDAEECHGLRHA
ncbi:WD40/YVTN/BNR-like repeat-containing protein [Neoroseomonas oryzicola]|nr:sialidase family protein [Neoroseomonas oryzicola]